MADKERRRGKLSPEDLLMQNGTYFNPVNAMIVVVDDADYLDMSQVDLTELSGDDWVVVSDESLTDSSRIEEILQHWLTDGGAQNWEDISITGQDQQG